MKQLLLLLSCTFTLLTSCASCRKDAVVQSSGADSVSLTTPTGNKMKFTVGTESFTATLDDHATADAFKALLPLTVDMVDLNRNEKYAELSSNLPTAASNPGSIQSGDLMLYGSSTVVLFYKSFSTSYNYTRLGKVDHPARLAEALGSGSINVTFSAE